MRRELDDALPVGWAASTIGQLVEVRYGKGLSTKQLCDAGYPVFGANGQIGFYDSYTHEDSEVLVTCRGATCGTVNVSPPRCFVTSNSLVLQPRSGDVLDKGYLRYFLEGGRVSSVITGTAQPQITLANLNPFEVPLPPLNEQRRIVAKIEALFARSRRAKEALDAIPPLLDRLRQSILAAAFRGDLTADWRAQHPDVEPADKLLERIRTERRRRWEEAELAEMRANGKQPKDEKWKRRYEEPEGAATATGQPPGWSTASVIELALIESGQTPKNVDTAAEPNGEVPFYRVADMNQQGNEKVMTRAVCRMSVDAAASLGLHVRPKGTLIFPKRGGAIHTNKKRILGAAAAYDLNTMGLVPACAEIGELLWYWLASIDLASFSDGSNIPQLNNGDIAPLVVPVPPAEELQVMASKLERALSSLDRLAEEHEQAQEKIIGLEASTLAAAFRGELVQQDPADEPGSLVLSRLERATAAAQIQSNRRARGKTETRAAQPPEVRSEQQQLSLAGQEPGRPELRTPDDYSREQWRSCLLHAVNGEALERDDAIRLAAEWARDNLGLEFKRLRADGKIVKGLKSAMNSAIRTGELERVGAKKVRRVQ